MIASFFLRSAEKKAARPLESGEAYQVNRVSRKTE